MHLRSELFWLLTLGFYTESERLVHNEKWAQVNQQCEMVGPIVDRIFEDAENGVLLLSRTPSLKIQTLNADDDPKSAFEARTTLEDAFVGMLQSVQSLQQIRYLSLTDGQAARSRQGQADDQSGLVRFPQSRLRVPTRIEAIRAASSAEPGEISYSSIWFPSPGDAWVSLAVPLFDEQDGALQGVLEADVDLSGAFHSLSEAALQRVRFLIAKEDGELVYNHYEETLDPSTSFEDLFPDLGNVWDSSPELLVDDAQGQPLARIITLSSLSSPRPTATGDRGGSRDR